MAQLLIRNGPTAGTGFKLTAFPVTIGRDPSNDLALEDGNASEFHAEILETEDGLVIEDLGSSNGTWLNGERVEEGILNEGDTVHVGVTELTFVKTDASATALLTEEEEAAAEADDEESALTEPDTEHLPRRRRRRRVGRVEDEEPAPAPVQEYAEPEESVTLKRGPVLSGKSIIIALVVIAVLATPAYLMSLLGGGVVGKALRYAPDGFPVLVHAKIADIQKSDVFKQLAPGGISSLPEVGGIEREMRGMFGLGADDIDSATAFVVPAKQEVTVVLKCKRPIDVTLMQSGENADRFKKIQLGENEVYSDDSGSKAIFLPDNKTMVVSTMRQLETALIRGRGADRTQGMKQAMGKISKGATLALAMDGAMLAAPGLPGKMPTIPGMDLAQSVRAMTLNVGLAKNVKIDWSILCKDKQVAEDLSKMAEAALVAAKTQMKALPPGIAPVLNDIKISTSGPYLNSKVSVDPALLTGAIGVKPAAMPGGVTPSPMPGGVTPAAMPGGVTPSPMPGGVTPSPAPGGVTPAPAPGGVTPAPAPGGVTPGGNSGGSPFAAPSTASPTNRARQCVLALTMYSLDKGGAFPANLNQLITDGYLKSADLIEWQDSAQWTYFQGLSSSSPAGHVVLASPGLTADGKRVVGFIDGRIQTIPDAEFRTLLQTNAQTMP